MSDSPSRNNRPLPRPNLTRSSPDNSAHSSASSRQSEDDQPPPLLAGLTAADFTTNIDSTTLTGSNNNNVLWTVPPRPRRLWKVSDTALRPVPPFWPPLHSNCTAYVSDAPPSVVAIRIAECLRLRNVSVEYDEEAIIATCMTIDRCHFVVHLWQPTNTASLSSTSTSSQVQPDFSHGVLVEVQHARGDAIVFHRNVRAILNAALSFDTGKDIRKVYQCSPMEYPRLKNDDKIDVDLVPMDIEDATVRAQEALEYILQLLRKDRLDAQQLGMQSLVSLTDAYTTGPTIAQIMALAVLGRDVELHLKWIVKPIQDRVLPNEDEPGLIENLSSSHRDDATSVDEPGASGGAASLGDEHFGGIMRAMALRALANSLSVLSLYDEDKLESILRKDHYKLVSRPFLSALLEDTLGASRPPAVVAGTRLASPHEAVLAIRCLRLLGQHCERARRRILTDSSMQHLLKARNVGKAILCALEWEADQAHTQLSEDERSC